MSARDCAYWLFGVAMRMGRRAPLLRLYGKAFLACLGA